MKTRWNQIAIAVAAGFLMGAFFSDFYHMHLKRRPPQSVPVENPMERLTQELDLSGPQTAEVSAVFEKYRPEVRKTRESIKPELEAIRLKIKSDLKAVLTPQQYEKFDKLDNDSKLRGDPPPPPRGQGPADRRHP